MNSANAGVASFIHALSGHCTHPHLTKQLPTYKQACIFSLSSTTNVKPNCIWPARSLDEEKTFLFVWAFDDDELQNLIT